MPTSLIFIEESDLELQIEGLSHDGRGVARVGQKAVFVSGALPGERVQARLLKRHRQYDEAATVNVLDASPDRVVPRCAHTDACSGCSLQHLQPAVQIELKQQHLLDNLTRIGKATPRRILPPLQREVWGYRRKARMSVRYISKKGGSLVGFREENGRFVAEIDHCPVLDPRVGLHIKALSELVSSMDARAAIAQIEVAAGAQVVLVFRNLVPLTDADRSRLQVFAERHCFQVVMQPAGLDSLYALDGGAVPELEYQVDGDINIRYRPLDFVQVNDSINRAMVDQAIDLLQPGASDRVLDLYCGLGNFTLPLARRAGQVTGVEGDAGLIARARANAERNGFGNTDFHVADLSQDQGASAWSRASYTRILLDPPRAGAERVFDYLPGKEVERMVYVSCHPATLARDVAILNQRIGFDLEAVGVMDMFPHTSHVESMALFVRR